MAFLLDFEKPLVDLEDKLHELRAFQAEDGTVDLSEQIGALELRVETLRTSIFRSLTRWQRVQLARHPDRPYTLDYIGALTTDFRELHGDRLFGDDRALVGGFATFEGHRYGSTDRTVMILGHQKGRNTKQRKERRFGMPNPEGYRKARRLMEMAAKFGKPIITLLDTPGAYPGLKAEERGQAEAIAVNLREMSRLRTPIVCVVIGEGGSGGALGIAIGDRVAMLEYAWYSVISPEGCAAILWKKANEQTNTAAARALALTAKENLANGLIDDVIKEPVGGAHRDMAASAKTVQGWIVDRIRELKRSKPETLVQRRYEKLRRIGAVAWNPPKPGDDGPVDE